ncbi:hypothetical protein OTU49_017467 [Cherax quadricarinatus]|uniref:Uncharacterized protein n=1 Tax=Cherax quadricarinatus TaxID=27406 RepID=A0AAW0WQ30_CHEQU
MNLKRLMSCLLLVGTIWCIVLSMSSHSHMRLENLVLGLLAGFSASYIVQLIITCYNSSHKGGKEIYCENKAENPTQTAREETIQDMDDVHFFTQLTDNTIKESSWTTVAGRNRRIKNNKPNKNELNNKTYANAPKPKATYYKPDRVCEKVEVAPDLRKVILGSGGTALTQFTKTY